MGWGNGRTKTGWKRAEPEVVAAIAAGAAQLPAAFLLWWFHSLAADAYGRGYGGGFGLACLFLFAPGYLPVLGLLHAWTNTLPGIILADLALARLRWPRWGRHLLGVTLIGVGWAAVTSLLWDWPFLAVALVLAALGVLPVLAMAYTRRKATGSTWSTGRTWSAGRPWSTWGVWWRAGVSSVALFVLAFAGAALADATGLIEEYEPPELSAAKVAGVWRGDDGAELRLLPGGRAESARMPAEGEFGSDEDMVVCDGAGTWAYATEGPYEARGRVVVRLSAGSGTDSGCGDETTWRVSGTDRAPELFVIFGDPDGGELRILKRDAAR
ncbi:hypothetical protein [Streptomyces sp. 3214.6]|uniref:hypothetical protein n=1 Tax=Streptomyces sp. 3214.6 TaxID=1882757 RepID=UPI00090A9EFC|nr:hypothetical protein [Streptomyces sp. 3214.6]SHI18785.1 hypothetical protein SAMN05444521_5048 [Streptomyces sp. 3214.6]